MPVQDKASTITTDLGSGESLRVGDVVIELLEKSGKRARLRLQAPRGKDIEKKTTRQVAPIMAT